jgi:hypothetical protein
MSNKITNVQVNWERSLHTPITCPEGSRGWGSQISRQLSIKVVKLWALPTGRPYLPGKIPGIHFCYRLSRLQGHSATGRILSMKTFNDTIGKRTHDLPACSSVPHSTISNVHGRDMRKQKIKDQ